MTKVILGTGTNAARAGSLYNVDHYRAVTYFDMLMSKGRLANGETVYTPRRNLPFKMATNLSRIPGVEFYQTYFPLVGWEEANPSWNKAIANVSKAKGFISSIFDALLNGGGEREYMHLEQMFGAAPTGIMIWLPETGSKKNIDAFVKLLAPIASEWEVMALHGDITNNREAELVVKNAHALAIRNGKRGVIVCAMKMGSRSFSVPTIDTVILAYDNGSAAGTAQKMSRGLTPYANGTEKTGRVVSIAVDPTREDKIDAPILETAAKEAEKTGESITDALRRVMRTLNVYTMDHESGERIEVNIDEYLKKVLSVNSLSRVIAKTADLTTILNDDALLQGILGITAETDGLGDHDDAREKGSKFLDKKGKVKKNLNPKDPSEKKLYELMKQVEAAIEALTNNTTHIVGMTQADTIEGALVFINNNYAGEFEQEFGVTADFVRELITRGVVSGHLINVKIGVEFGQISTNVSAFWN